MTKNDEAKIRREGFPLTQLEAQALLDFINLKDPKHFMVEPEIIVKLEIMIRKYILVKNK